MPSTTEPIQLSIGDRFVRRVKELIGLQLKQPAVNDGTPAAYVRAKLAAARRLKGFPRAALETAGTESRDSYRHYVFAVGDVLILVRQTTIDKDVQVLAAHQAACQSQLLKADRCKNLERLHACCAGPGIAIFNRYMKARYGGAKAASALTRADFNAAVLCFLESIRPKTCAA